MNSQREPENTKEAACAAADFRGAPRTLRGRPSGVKGAAHRCATACGRSGHRSLCGPRRQEERAGQDLPSPDTRRAIARCHADAGRGNELAFDNSQTKNYKNLVRGSLHTSRGLPPAPAGPGGRPD